MLWFKAPLATGLLSHLKDKRNNVSNKASFNCKANRLTTVHVHHGCPYRECSGLSALGFHKNLNAFSEEQIRRVFHGN